MGRNTSMVILAVGVLFVGTAPVSAALVGYWTFDGDTAGAGNPVANQVSSTFDGTQFGSVAFSSVDVPTALGSGQSLDLTSGNTYVRINSSSSTQTGSVSWDGRYDNQLNTSLAISAWVKGLPNGTPNGDWRPYVSKKGESNHGYQLRRYSNTNDIGTTIRGTSAADDIQGVGTNMADNQWHHAVMTWSGSSRELWFDGNRQYAVADTGTMGSPTNEFLVFGARDNPAGTISAYSHIRLDDVAIYNTGLAAYQVAHLAGGGAADSLPTPAIIEDFEGYGSQIDTGRWYTSGGMNSTRLRSNRPADGTYLLGTFDNSAGDPAGNVRNVYNVQQDAVTSLTWGPAMRVLDESGSLSFGLAGGQQPVNEGSQRDGGGGLALWDLAANDFVRDGGNIRFVTPTGNQGSLQSQIISLAGLSGRTVLPVLYDREIGGWGWAELDSLAATPGTVEVSDQRHRVNLEFGFDEPGDLMGWTGDTGSFQVGRVGGTGPITRQIDLDGAFAAGEGFLSSTNLSSTETPTGALRSPNFVIDGDIIEFYVSGGSTSDMGFDLVRAADDFVLRTAGHQANDNTFDYEFWKVGDLNGTSAYLRLWDNRSSGGWGHIEIDAIRLVDFATVPEPSAFVLSALALLSLGFVSWRRGSRA